jgi:hypothetical protein
MGKLALPRRVNWSHEKKRIRPIRSGACCSEDRFHLRSLSAGAQSARFYAGTDAGRTIGTGLNVKTIRKAPSPMIHEPI